MLDRVLHIVDVIPQSQDEYGWGGARVNFSLEFFLFEPRPRLTTPWKNKYAESKCMFPTCFIHHAPRP
jgi:hypothetical protein